MLAVPADRLPDALGDLDPGNRALLDLSLRRGVSDVEIGELLRKEPTDVARGRDAVLELLADALDVAGPDRRERVREAVAALPDEAWRPATPPPPPPPPPAASPPPPSERVAPREPLKPDLDLPPVDRDRGDELYFEPTPRRSRRSRRGGLLLVLALLAVLGAVLALILSGGDDDGSNESGSQPAPKQDQPAPAPDGRGARLAALPGGRGEGRLVVTDEGATITLRGLPEPDGAYHVWLYDSVVDAKSLGTITEGSGKLEVQLPADARRYVFLDVSLEPADGNPNHSGDSVLRAPLRDLLRGGSG
jgi:hypothetical protein